jgi:hypothetical protein
LTEENEELLLKLKVPSPSLIDRRKRKTTITTTKCTNPTKEFHSKSDKNHKGSEAKIFNALKANTQTTLNT